MFSVCSIPVTSPESVQLVTMYTMYTRTRILVHGLKFHHVLLTSGTGIDHTQKKGQLISWNKTQRPGLLRVYFTKS